MRDQIEEAVTTAMGCFGVCVTLGGIAGAILASAWVVVKAVVRIFEMFF